VHKFLPLFLFQEREREKERERIRFFRSPPPPPLQPCFFTSRRAASRKSIWYGLLERRPRQCSNYRAFARRLLRMHLAEVRLVSLSSPDAILRTRRFSPDVACKQRKCVILLVIYENQRLPIQLLSISRIRSLFVWNIFDDDIFSSMLLKLFSI